MALPVRPAHPNITKHKDPRSNRSLTNPASAPISNQTQVSHNQSPSNTTPTTPKPSVPTSTMAPSPPLPRPLSEPNCHICERMAETKPATQVGDTRGACSVTVAQREGGGGVRD